MTIREDVYGTLADGREVPRWTIEGKQGSRIEVLALGAIVSSLRLVADDPGSEMVVGFDTIEQQQASASAYFGAVVGRYANRLANGRFTIDGEPHQATQNEGNTALHGGLHGFDSRIWQLVDHGEDSITLELVSPDGDQGFPGELTAHATYRLLDDGLQLTLRATTDRPTVCALTSHLYLDLGVPGSLDDLLLQVDASHYVPIDERSIPLGTIDPVDGTPFDLRRPTRIGQAVRTDHPQVTRAKGIDHSFDVDGAGFRRMARVEVPETGRVLEVFSDQPALQVYTGNFLDGLWTSRTGRLRQGDALALEPHIHPDTPNQPWAEDAVLRPGQEWSSRIEWRFTTRESTPRR